MNLWQTLSGMFGRGAKAAARPAVRARYENAQSTDETARSWWLVDYLSAKSANNFQVRRTLRTRSRHEVSNNPYLFGIVNSNADDLIDKGPTLQLLTSDSIYNRSVEALWQEWAEEVGLVEKLRTAKLAKTVDGEGFLVLKTVNDLESPVKLYPVDVEADQVTTWSPTRMMELWVDGLDLHPVTGQPTNYTVLRQHPGDYWFGADQVLKSDKIKAQYVIHWFNKFRPGQVRGIPAFTSALDLFTELRAFRKATLGAAQIAANFTAVLESELNPADADDADTGTPFDHIPIDRFTMTTLPAKTKLKQMEAEHPTTTYEQFQERCLGEACRPISYPLNLALGTSQKFNFSSAKLDHINYRQSLTVERGQCERIALNRIFRAWYEEATLAGAVAIGGKRGLGMPAREWHWPGFPTLDAEKDTKADISQISAGTLTWREFWAKRGYDWREVMAQQADEKAEIEKLGLEFGDPLKRSETSTETSDTEELVDVA